MPQLQTYSTAGLEPRRRIDYWNGLACHSITQLVISPLNRRDFSGRLARTEVGPIRLVDIESDPAVVHHSRRHIAQSLDPVFLLCMQLDGESHFRQNGREALLRPSDFTLCDSTLPYEISFDHNRMLVLGIGQQTLRRYIASPEAVVALPMSGRAGLSGLLSSFLRNFWQQYSTRVDVAFSDRIGSALLELAASAYAVVPQAAVEGSTLKTAWRVRIREHIETHLHDPDMTPQRIADALHMSARYLHHLFEDNDETAARYILRRRLDECARAMLDGSRRSRSLLDIALGFGFNNASHFGRVFRQRFGVSPSEYRRRGDS
jgi:AraC family transcriptional regulator, positive regulator of tynA and feaB